MRPPSEPPRDLADRMMRQALQNPANLRAFLRQVVPALADGFDCDRLVLLDREFPMDDWRHREADLPLEVPYRLGTEEPGAGLRADRAPERRGPGHAAAAAVLRGAVLGPAVAGVGVAAPAEQPAAPQPGAAAGLVHRAGGMGE